MIEQVKDGGVVLAPTGVNLQYLLAGIKDLSLSESFSISSYDVVSYVPLRKVWIDCRYEKQVFQFYFDFYYYFVMVGCTVPRPAPVETRTVEMERKPVEAYFKRKEFG